MNKHQRTIRLITLLVFIPIVLSAIIGCSTQPSTMITPQPSSPVQPGILYITSNEAWQHVGEYKVVEYYVAYPFRSSKGNIFLNEKADYKNGFTATIFSSSTASSGDPIAKYGYKTIRVRGTISTYEGHPQIIVNNPMDITLVQ